MKDEKGGRRMRLTLPKWNGTIEHLRKLERFIEWRKKNGYN